MGKKFVPQIGLYMTHTQLEKARNCLRVQGIVMNSMNRIFDVNNLSPMTTKEMIVAYIDSDYHKPIYSQLGVRGDGQSMVSKRMYQLLMVNAVQKVKYTARSKRANKVLNLQQNSFVLPIIEFGAKEINLRVFGRITPFGRGYFNVHVIKKNRFCKLIMNDKGFFSASFVPHGAKLYDDIKKRGR